LPQALEYRSHPIPLNPANCETCLTLLALSLFQTESIELPRINFLISEAEMHAFFVFGDTPLS
jgi:hypothetical protein